MVDVARMTSYHLSLQFMLAVIDVKFAKDFLFAKMQY